MNYLWNKFLDENYCHQNSITGNRPCDDGKICDNCLIKDAQELFIIYQRLERLEVR